MKKQLLRRTTAIILALCMLIGMVPVGYAADMPLYEITLDPNAATYTDLIAQIDDAAGSKGYLKLVQNGARFVRLKDSNNNTMDIKKADLSSIVQVSEDTYWVTVIRGVNEQVDMFRLKVVLVDYTMTNITYGSDIPDTVAEIKMTVNGETATIPKATESVSYEDGTTVKLRIPVVEGYTPVVKYNNTEVTMKQDMENADDYVGTFTVAGDGALHIDYALQLTPKTIELYINAEKIQSITEYVGESLSDNNIPTKTDAGDTITSWKGADGKEYILNEMPDYAGRLDAVIVAKQYTLNFSANNGTGNTTSVLYDAKEGTMPACPKDRVYLCRLDDGSNGGVCGLCTRQHPDYF